MLSGSSLKFRTGTITPKEKRTPHDQLVFSKSPTSVRTGTAHAKTGRTNSDNPSVVKTKSDLSMLRSSTREIITHTDEGIARKSTPCRARAQSGTKSSSKSLFDKTEPKMAVKHISRPKADPASPGTYLPPAHTATRLRSPVTPSTNTPLRARSTVKFSSHSTSSPIVSRCLMDHRDYQTGRKSKGGTKENTVCSYSPISSSALQRSSLILSGINTPKRSSSSIKKVGSESPIKAINGKPSRLSMQNVQLQSPSTRSTGYGKRISQTVLSSKRTPMNVETLTPKDKRSPRSPLRPLLLPLLVAQRESKLQYPYTPSEPGRVYISSSSSSPSSLPRRSSSMAYVAKARDPDATTLSAHGATYITPRKASPGRSRDEIHSRASSATLLSRDGNAQRVSLNEEDSETDYLADASYMKDNTRKDSPLQNRLAEIMIPFNCDNVKTSEGASESYTTHPILALCMIGSAISNTPDVIQPQKVDISVQTDNIPELLYKKIVSYTSASVDTADFDEYLTRVQLDKAKLDRSNNVEKLFKSSPHTANKPTSILCPKITNINTAPKHQNPPVILSFGSNHHHSIPHPKPPHSTLTSKANKEKEKTSKRDIMTRPLQYRIRPPSYSNQTSTVKKNANAEIELELEYLRSRTKVAKGVVMLDRRVTIFGTGQCAKDVKDIKEIKRARVRSSEGGDANVVDSDGEQLSLKALAILHRMKQNGKEEE